MRSLVAVVAAGLVASASLARAEVVEFDVDASHTFVSFAVKHMVVSTTKGKFNDFSGSFSVDPADPTTLKASAKINVTSVDTANEKRDDHLRSPDFFDAAQFPEITFVTTGTEKTEDGVVLTGDLTIKGVTKSVSIPVSVNGPITDPWGNARYGFEGGTKVNRQDWGLTWSKTMDGGGLVVGDEVRIEISVEGIQKK